MMGGRLEVTSHKGVGSIFKLLLPYRRSDEPPEVSTLEVEAATTEETTETDELQGKVLVVEDTRALQLLEKKLLERMGLSVDLADNGKEALERLEQASYDLILMDMQMPVMDGVEATIQLRSLGIDTPVIAISANVMQRHRDDFEAAGCNVFLSKPIDQTVLQRQVRRLLTNPQEDGQNAP